MTYYETAGYVSNSYNRESRLRAIAMNAVREAVIAFGRVDLPFSDNDAAITENVFMQLKEIGEESNVLRQNEHQSLANAKDAPKASSAQIAAVLDTLGNELRAEATDVVKAKVPTAKN
jgi:hypothetical protein